MTKLTMTLKPVIAQGDHKEIPREPKAEEEALGRGKNERTKRVPFSPTTKGQYHKAVGSVETSEEIGEHAHKTKDSTQTDGSGEFNIARTSDAAGSGTNTTSKGEIEQKPEPINGSMGQTGPTRWQKRRKR